MLRFGISLARLMIIFVVLSPFRRACAPSALRVVTFHCLAVRTRTIVHLRHSFYSNSTSFWSGQSQQLVQATGPPINERTRAHPHDFVVLVR